MLVPVLVWEAPNPIAPEYSAALIAKLPEAEILTVIVLLVLVPAVAV